MLKSGLGRKKERKRDFAGVIELRILRWRDYPGLLGGPKYNGKCLYKREAEEDLTTEEKAMR